MRISRAEEYGVRLVMRLAAHGRQLTVTQLAELENLPEPTVAKVLVLLRRGGIVRAERGRHGGYSLSSSPSRISVGQVLEALGEPLFEGRFCYGAEVSDDRGCPREDGCGLRSVWRHIETMVMRVLFGTSLNDLLHGEESVEAHVGDLWPLRTGSGSGRPPTIEIEDRARDDLRPAYKES